MWIVPPFGEAGLVVYYALTYVLFDTCFTVVGVAYNSLTPTLTSDYDEQSSINGIRMVYSIAGSLGAVILGTVLQWVIDDEGKLFLMLGILLSIVITIPPLVVARVTRGRDSHSGGSQPPTWTAVRQVLSNRPFGIVMGVYLTSWTAVSLVAANLVYYARYNLGVPEQASYFVLVAQGVALVFIPVVVGAARKWDKRSALFLGYGSMVPVLAAIAAVPATQYPLVYVLAALLGLGIATAYVTPWSMIPDVIQWDARKTGARREASYYAIVSFFQKLGTAGALWIVGSALDARGYVTPTESTPIPAQPETALASVRGFISVVPAALLLVSMAFAYFYPISRSVQSEVVAELEERGI
jgi:GPH family glycoside/pentoside/hexuronide:cation symporter